LWGRKGGGGRKGRAKQQHPKTLRTPLEPERHGSFFTKLRYRTLEPRGWTIEEKRRRVRGGLKSGSSDFKLKNKEPRIPKKFSTDEAEDVLFRPENPRGERGVVTKENRSQPFPCLAWKMLSDDSGISLTKRTVLTQGARVLGVSRATEPNSGQSGEKGGQNLLTFESNLLPKMSKITNLRREKIGRRSEQ